MPYSITVTLSYVSPMERARSQGTVRRPKAGQPLTIRNRVSREEYTAGLMGKSKRLQPDVKECQTPPIQT